MAKRTRACPDCGTDITDRHGNAKRCDPCSDASSRAYQNGYRARSNGECLAANDECNPGRLRRGYCEKHYHRVEKYGVPTLPERVDPWTLYRVTNTECWEWTGVLNPAGYGHGPDAMGDRLAHRAFYKRYVGPIPSDLELDHLCRNRACVNPKHLEAVTHQENLQRGWDARLAGRCVNDLHDVMTEEDWYTDPGTGMRRCKACWRASYQKAQRAYKTRKYAERGEVYIPKQRPKPGHCAAGHEIAGDNVYVVPSTGDRRCRECLRARRQERTERERTKPPRDPSRCGFGHEWTQENTYLTPGGAARQCRACNRRREQERRRRRAVA